MGTECSCLSHSSRLVGRRRWRYPQIVKRRRINLPRLVVAGLSLLWAIGVLAEAAPTRIRLRNEVIDTTKQPREKAATQPSVQPVSGLFLIQFTNHLDIAWRNALRA